MEDFIKVTKADLVAIFTEWNAEADQHGSWDTPVNAEKQADHMFDLAHKRFATVEAAAAENSAA